MSDPKHFNDSEQQDVPAGAGSRPLGEVAALFLKLGFVAFGGPAAHIALMRDEVVRRRSWVSDERFLDLLAACNLIPGPTSTELAIFLGYVRAGWAGLVLAGALFILPATLIVLAFAWAYVRFGALPQVSWLLYGLKPVIIVIILQAVWGLSRTALKGILSAAIGIAVFSLSLLGLNEIALLLGGGLLFMLIRNAGRLRSFGIKLLGIFSLGLPSSVAIGSAAASFSGLMALFLSFLKIGAVVFGSGYVLLAFLRGEFVNRLGWLTDRQLIDAVAVGQFTPGPVFTTATFIGYLLGGLKGALLATIGIFLPSFILVAVVFPLVQRLRNSPWTGALLDGINVSALGLMAAVSFRLGQAAFIDSFTWIIALAAAIILFRFKINSTWIILGGGLASLFYHLLMRG